MGAAPGRFVVFRPRDVVGRDPKSPRARKVTFGAQKSLFRSESDFWAPKVTFYPEDNFCSKSHFSRFRPPGHVEIHKGYVGFAAVARTGAKESEFMEFSVISTFGAKMHPKVTFFDFDPQK